MNTSKQVTGRNSIKGDKIGQNNVREKEEEELIIGWIHARLSLAADRYILMTRSVDCIINPACMKAAIPHMEELAF